MSQKKLSILDEFNKYLGNHITRLSAFKGLDGIFDIKKVIYPGSYCDVIPSLIFSDVVYVDSFKKTDKFFRDKAITNYINNHKQYAGATNIEFYLADYGSTINSLNSDYDLLISLSAGYISISCKKYLKKDGLLIVNNDHYDAARAYLEKDYRLIGVFHFSDEIYIYSQSNLNDYFKLKTGEKLTLEKFNLLSSKPPSKSLKKFFRNSDLYLFRKVT